MGDRRRHDETDAREAAADQREQEDDIREGVLDRWERELTAQALSLQMFDDADEASQALASRQRAEAHRRRRDEAEARHDAAIARGIERAGRGEDEAHSAPRLDSQVRRALERLAELVESSGSLSESLNAIVGVAMDALTDADAVTVSLAIAGRLEPAASSAAWAADLDAVQLRGRAGPIVEAVETRTVVVSDDLAADQRWHLAGSIEPIGSRGVLSAAIVVSDAVSGVLTAYSEPGRSFDRRSVLTAAMLASQASLAVGWSLERVSHQAQNEAWERALASRDEIGQAKGILMALHDLTADAAFELMRATSQHHNAKVRDIAHHVTTHRRLPEAPTSGQHDQPSGS